MEHGKTIKQIADEIGVTKQAVYKRYKGKLYTVCAPYTHTERGTLYLLEQAETIIKKDFLKNDHSNKVDTECSSGVQMERQEESGIIAVLQTSINALQEQLCMKDRQIEQLSVALVAAQQTAQAAQALHAGTMQQHSEENNPMTERECIKCSEFKAESAPSEELPVQIEPELQHRRSFLQRIFKK